MAEYFLFRDLLSIIFCSLMFIREVIVCVINF